MQITRHPLVAEIGADISAILRVHRDGIATVIRINRSDISTIVRINRGNGLRAQIPVTTVLIQAVFIQSDLNLVALGEDAVRLTADIYHLDPLRGESSVPASISNKDSGRACGIAGNEELIRRGGIIPQLCIKGERAIITGVIAVNCEGVTGLIALTDGDVASIRDIIIDNAGTTEGCPCSDADRAGR